MPEVRVSRPTVQPPPPLGIQAALLTGGFDKPYVFGLSMALAAKGVCLDVIGGDAVDRPELHSPPLLNFLNLRGRQLQEDSLWQKVTRVLRYYARLIRYALVAQPKIFHIVWNNKFQVFDRTVLMLLYKLRGRKVVFTAHNVNAGRRDGNDSALNRVSLKIQYRLADHIFVHTEKMKAELLAEYGVGEASVTVIPFGINNAVPDTDLTPAEAKRKLGISSEERTILFFGAIRPYKGVQHLVAAFQQIAAREQGYRLIIAGEGHSGSQQYLMDLGEQIAQHSSRERVTKVFEFVPDEETELYFKAADLLVLPYTEVFQSGVLFLAYSFGLPVVATDVGSFRDDIVAGETGYLCPSCDPADLAAEIEKYFNSDLFRHLDSRRAHIREYARARNSWEIVGEKTRVVYADLLNAR